MKFFAKGRRGYIYREGNIAKKITNPKSKAINRIQNEIKFLKILNKYNIGPKLLKSGKDYFTYEFVEGQYMDQWWKKANIKQKIKVCKNLLHQCYILDKLGIIKEDMHRPSKNVVIKKYNVPVLIDFERCHYGEGKNVTQLLQFMGNNLIPRNKAIKLAKKYSKEKTISFFPF
ncbi:hypothetical protein KY334_05825 [Candidatus Woesearchaeota archaeon]|nr:hypothetical protein [Candidatus Woesearchaeota archaeon]